MYTQTDLLWEKAKRPCVEENQNANCMPTDFTGKIIDSSNRIILFIFKESIIFKNNHVSWISIQSEEALFSSLLAAKISLGSADEEKLC